MRGRPSITKITRDGDGNLFRKARSDALVSRDRRDVEDHSLSKYDHIYNYQTKSTIQRGVREEREIERGGGSQE